MAVYAVLKEAEPKQITCVLTIGYSTNDQTQDSNYGYVNAPPISHISWGRYRA